MENTTTVPQAQPGQRLMYGLGATVAVLAIVLLTSLFSNSSKATQINTLNGQLTGLHVELIQHDSAAAEEQRSLHGQIDGLHNVIAQDSARINNDRLTATKITASLEIIGKQLKDIEN